MWYLKKNAYAESTIKAVDKRLKHLSKYCNLEDPENVKGFVASKNCSNGYKESLIETYNYYTETNARATQKPVYLKLMHDFTKSLTEILGLQSVREDQEHKERQEEAKKELQLLTNLLEQK